jgi:hypothetical protein
MKRLAVVMTACSLVALAAVPAHAQLNGSHTLGDFGVMSGSQPAPGFYSALFYLHYGTDTIRNADGEAIGLGPEDPTSVGISAFAPMVWYVSKAKVLGANYGALIVFPFANAQIEAPAFRLERSVDSGFGDMLIRPIDLGWHAKRADFAAGLQIYPPTGRYQQGGSDNLGKGMWSYEPFVGTTVYLDEKKSFSFAATAYWEIHGKKADSQTRVGQLLTLQGGLGKSFLGGGLVIGGAYYAQWKVTEDQLRAFELPGGGAIAIEARNKHQVFGLGPDVTLPIATRSKLYALVNVRYLWETGARVKTEGETLAVTATFPIPSLKLK